MRESRRLAVPGLPHGLYLELWNSTWPAFAIPTEFKDEHTNGAATLLHRSRTLRVPDFGAVMLSRV